MPKKLHSPQTIVLWKAKFSTNEKNIIIIVNSNEYKKILGRSLSSFRESDITLLCI